MLSINLQEVGKTVYDGLLIKGRDKLMRNYRFLINEQFQANSIAEDLRVQLDVNRYNHVNILSVDNRNEVLVQVFESSGGAEETVETFMQDYQKGIIIE